MELPWSGIRFGPKTYTAFSGVTGKLIALVVLALILAAVAQSATGFLSIGAWVAVALFAWIVFGMFMLRLRDPWRKHHYSLMMIYSGVLGAMYARYQNAGALDERIAILLHAAFPDMNKQDLDRLVAIARANLFEYLDGLGAINKNPPGGHIDVQRFRETLEQYQRDNPHIVERSLVFASIIGAHEGHIQAGVYLFATMHGTAA